MVWICISPVIRGVECLFMSFDHLYVSIEKFLFRSSANFLISGFDILMLSCVCPLYIRGVNPFQMYDLQYLLPFRRLPRHAGGFSCCVEAFQFGVSHFLFLAFIVCPLGVISEHHQDRYREALSLGLPLGVLWFRVKVKVFDTFLMLLGLVQAVIFFFLPKFRMDDCSFAL